MKKLLLLLLIFLSLPALSQAPEMFRYQAVARDATGAILADQAVGFQIRIIQTSTSGTAVYVETHAAMTNEFGLVNLTVGNGSVTAGDFSTIDWGADLYFMEVAMDETGGSSYTVMGTSQLLSVPYALYAETAGSGPAGPTGPIGPAGPPGADGADGADGLACWDLNGDGIQDAGEDVNSDGSWDALDCAGPPGADGTDGADGATGAPGLDGADGATGAPGAPGADGADGATGATGPSGVTGQSVTDAYGTAQIVPPISASFSLIPGLTQTVTVPSNCYVVVSTDGGVQCSLTGANFAVVDIAIHVDGVASPAGGRRRIVAANTSSLGQVITNWSMTKTYSLTAGAHTIEVGVQDDGSGSANANVSSGTDPRLQGTLTVMFIKF